MRLGFVAALASVALGCSARLVVHPVTDPSQFHGIRVRAAASFVVTKQIETEKCAARTEESIVHLPVGEPYDVNFAGGLFAKNEFSVAFNDSGVLKQVSLNSDPQLDESLNAAANLVEKAGAAALATRARDCGDTTSERIVAVRRLEVPK